VIQVKRPTQANEAWIGHTGTKGNGCACRRPQRAGARSPGVWESRGVRPSTAAKVVNAPRNQAVLPSAAHLRIVGSELIDQLRPNARNSRPTRRGLYQIELAMKATTASTTSETKFVLCISDRNITLSQLTPTAHFASCAVCSPLQALRSRSG
jgi:hypothetical protein